jgi:hypothetical protein
MTARISVNGELRVYGRAVEIIVKPRWTDADLEAAAALDGAPVRFSVEPEGATERAALPTVEQIKGRLRAALPNYRALGFEPSPKNVITDISAEVLRMLEEARR